VLAISTDPVATQAALGAKLGLSFRLLSDPELAAIDAYGVRHPKGNPMEAADIARPAAFLIDEQGRIAWRELTDDWRVRLDPERVLEQLDAMD
jgi:peroxiredoxin Q/BCP